MPRDNADEMEDRDQSGLALSEECANGEHPSCEYEDCACLCHEPDEEE
jgi:hypothetical protein